MDRIHGRPRSGKRLAGVGWLIDHHRDELEYELIRNGLRLRMLGGPLLTFNEVWLIAVNAPAGGRLAAAIDERLSWDRTDTWLSSIEYSLRWLVWSRTRDGQRNRRRPKPVTPPGTPRAGTRSMVSRRDTVGMGKHALREYLSLPRTATPPTTQPTGTR